jgi:hypothetical protein
MLICSISVSSRIVNPIFPPSWNPGSSIFANLFRNSIQFLKEDFYKKLRTKYQNKRSLMTVLKLNRKVVICSNNIWAIWWNITLRKSRLILNLLKNALNVLKQCNFVNYQLYLNNFYENLPKIRISQFRDWIPEEKGNPESTNRYFRLQYAVTEKH